MNWNRVKHHFVNDGALIDIYYETMNDTAWLRLFNWISSNVNVTSVNCYIPATEQNFEYFPRNLVEQINEEGFYCFVSLLVDDFSLFLRFYEKDELECDIDPKKIDCKEKLVRLLKTLDEIKEITGTKKYIMCPENCKKGTFNINGKFIR